MGDLRERWTYLKRMIQRKFLPKSKRARWRALLRAVLLVGLTGGAVTWLVQRLMLKYPAAMAKVVASGDALMRGGPTKPLPRSLGMLIAHLVGINLRAMTVAPIVLWRLYRSVLDLSRRR